jgi:hypothetical protein
MSISKTALLGGIAAIALATPALAEDRSSTKQKEQYLYQQSQDNKLGTANETANDSAIGPTEPNSGPGVQGAPDTRTGPSTRAPGGSADSNTGAPAGAETGTSTGEAGTGAGSMDKTTKPSQDSKGVQGFPDTRTGPSTREPGDASGAGSTAP